MKVHDRSGQSWRVTRRWVPWRRKWKGFWDLLPDLPISLADDGPLALIAFVLLLILMLPFLVLALIAGIEFLLLLLVYPFALLGRIIFGRHWSVEARKGFTPWFEVEAGSWSDSQAKISEIAAAIERGDVPPNNVDC